MSTKIIIHEIEQMGFWVEIEEWALPFLVMRHFLAADGSLEERSMVYPGMVVADGLFKDKSAACLAADQYAGIKARIEGKWNITVRDSISHRGPAKMTELEQLRQVAHEATRYLNGDGSRAELAKALQLRTQGRWTHVSLSSGKRGKVQGEEGQNVRIVDQDGSEHLVPKASLHLSWAPI